MTTAQGGHSLHREKQDDKSQNNLKKTFDKSSRTSGIASEVHDATGANNSYTDDDDDEILYGYEFKMTDDQQKAAGELQNLKLDLGFTEDEPGPFYDVSQRLRQLNEELAQEQIPEVEERNRKIQFKENLVDFVAPPPDHDMDDEPHTNRSGSDSGNSLEHKSDVKKNYLTVEEKDVGRSSVSSGASTDRRGAADDEPGSAPPKKGVVSKHDEEGVLLERNGRFEYVAVSDLTPEEREIYVVGPSSVLQSDDGPRSAPESSRSLTVKKPERKSSVASSVSRSDSTGSRPSNSSRGPVVTSARADSRADSQKVPTSARLNSYGNSQKKQPASSMSDIKKYEQKRKEDEAKRQKQEESDQIYQAWLKKKDEEKKKEKQKENKEDKEKEKDNEEAFENWKAKKAQQMRDEKRLKQEEAKYYLSQYQTPTDTECEKNFKTWLKNKKKIAREKEEEERQKMKTFRIMARRSRNSANAGGQGSSAYIDYYGYRY